MARETKKRSNRTVKRRLISIAAASLCLYFVYSIVSIQIQIKREKTVIAQLQQQINDQQLENDELSRIIANGGEDEYIERIAREKLGYAAPDERVFVDVAGQ